MRLPPVAIETALVAAAFYAAAHDPASIYIVTDDRGWLGGSLAPALALAATALAARRPSRSDVTQETARLRIPLQLSVPTAYFALYGVLQLASGQVSVERWIAVAITGIASAALGFISVARDGDVQPCLAGLALAGAAAGLEGILRLLVSTRDVGQLLVVSGTRYGSGDPYLANRLGNGMLPYPTLIASLFILCGSLTLGLAATAPTPRERFAWLGAWLLNGSCVLLTASRAGIVLFTLMSLAHLAMRGKGRALAAGATGFLVLGGALKLVATKGSAFRADGSMSSRVRMWRVCVHVARVHPLFGGGPGAFAKAWTQYIRGWRYPAYTVPHSTWFGLLADGGLTAIAMAGVLITGTVAATCRLVTSDAPESLRRLTLALAIGLGAVLAHDVVENSFRQTPVLMAACLLGGILCGARSRWPASAGTWRAGA